MFLKEVSYSVFLCVYHIDIIIVFSISFLFQVLVIMCVFFVIFY